MTLSKFAPLTVTAILLAACAQAGAQGPATMSNAPVPAPAPASVMVGGQQMFPGKDIVDNAVNSADHTTLVAAVKAAGLVQTLKGPGPYTVFAPTNDAFAKLPAGTVATLLKPENKATLTKVLTYHVVSGKLDFDSLHKMVMDANGTATLTTVAGEKLMVKMNGPHNILISDAKGDVAHITTYDVVQSNGVIQVIDKVMLPG